MVTGSFPSGLPADGTVYTRLGPLVESLGYGMLYVADHIFPHGSNCDPLALLGVFAGTTTAIELGTGIVLLPLREPIVTAKQLATVDYVSGGRLVVGVGVGGEFAHEWEAMGVPTTDRGRRTDEYLQLMFALWTSDVVEFDGVYTSVHGVTGTPSPARPGGPPIVIGGRSDAALQRAARHQGWCAYAMSPRRVAASIETIRKAAGGALPPGFRTSYVLFTAVADDERAAAARAERTLGARYQQNFAQYLDAFAAVGTPARLQAKIGEYFEAGVDDILISPQAPADDIAEQLHVSADVARRLLP